MAKKKIKKDSGEIRDPKVRAFITTFFSIIGFIVALIAWKDDEYTMFYAKQTLVVFIAYVVAGVVAAIPFIGWLLLGPVLYAIVTILWIFSWAYALSGKKKEVPIIGSIAKNFNF